MSSTTTTLQTATTRIQSRGYPADYDLHHSGISSADGRALSQGSNHSQTNNNNNNNPPDWPDNYRRVPPYRPINRFQDQTERRAGTSAVERMFLITMFTGLETNVIFNRIWKATGGRVTKDIFKYKIGGEY